MIKNEYKLLLLICGLFCMVSCEHAGIKNEMSDSEAASILFCDCMKASGTCAPQIDSCRKVVSEKYYYYRVYYRYVFKGERCSAGCQPIFMRSTIDSAFDFADKMDSILLVCTEKLSPNAHPYYHEGDREHVQTEPDTAEL
ncbi:MAG: hypothetical protein U0V74_06385 [Chitinophagales bacterium]